jgi:hypothetical protein
MKIIKMDNFDLKKYLVENKVTTNSQMMDEVSEFKFEPGSYFSAMHSDDPRAKAFMQNIKKAADNDMSMRYTVVNKLKDYVKANPEVKDKLDAAIEFINS